MKRILATFCCVLLVILSNSCTKKEYETFGDITGTVISKTADNDRGEPLSDAIVTLKPSTKTKYTGSDGSFEFEGLEAGQYRLLVQKDGYKSNFIDVRVTAGETTSVDFVMIKK